MLSRLRKIWEARQARRAAARWTELAARAETLPRSEVRRLRNLSRNLQRALERFRLTAEERLADPPVGSEIMRKHKLADWAFRPHPWRFPVKPHGAADVASGTAICDGVAIHHDSPGNNLVFRQIRSTGSDDLAPFSISLETLWRQGDFLSISLDIPENVALALRLRHILSIDLTWETEQPVDGFVRLNIRHGPNTEQIVRELKREQRETCVEFDLAYSSVNEKRVEHAWVDLIFEKPGFNRIVISDVTMSRRQRAEV